MGTLHGARQQYSYYIPFVPLDCLVREGRAPAWFIKIKDESL